MKRWVPIVILVAAAAALAWWLTQRHVVRNELVLYGNVDLREVDLAFNDSERVAAVLVQEGDRVKRGQILARLDTSRIAPMLEQAEAVRDAQRAIVARMLNGNRPQEIAQARANVELAAANARVAQTNNQRLVRVARTSNGRAVSQQDLDSARAATEVANAQLEVSRKALALAVLGPRKEDIEQAKAQLAADQAQVSYVQQQLADTELRAPLDATVSSRIAEPGDMSSPQKTAFTLAITDPKWVRAYVSETDLGRVYPGMPATVTVDAYPNRSFAAWVGFISSVAEFTPKTVETPDLRSSLVYEIRVFVKDPRDVLRLGMPATVHLSLAHPASKPAEAPRP
ncbi:MAG: efflux RND transporter periplasmic adaptor subunit [Steroidobacteraceae bacterium]